MNKIINSLKRRKALLLSVVAIFLVMITSGFTFSILKNKSGSVENTFVPSHSDIEVNEVFNSDSEKTSVTAKNKSEYPAYIRVKLVSYRVDETDNTTHIAGESSVPSFTLNSDWIDLGNNIYAYKNIVIPGSTTSNLIGSGSKIALKKYTDEDGGIQEIDVIAECIQAYPDSAVKDAWGVTLSEGVITGLKGAD